MQAFAGIPLNQTNMYQSQMEPPEVTEARLGIDLPAVNDLINSPKNPKIKAVNIYYDTAAPQSLLGIRAPAPILPRSNYFPLKPEQIDNTAKTHHCHYETPEGGNMECSQTFPCTACMVDPISVLPDHLAEGYPLCFQDSILGNAAVLWRKCIPSQTYHGMGTVFFSKDEITWKFENGKLLDPPAKMLLGGTPINSITFRGSQQEMNLEAKMYPHRVMSLGWEYLRNISSGVLDLETQASMVLFGRIARGCQNTSSPFPDPTHPSVNQGLINQHKSKVEEVIQDYYGQLMTELNIPLEKKFTLETNLELFTRSLPAMNPRLPKYVLNSLLPPKDRDGRKESAFPQLTRSQVDIMDESEDYQSSDGQDYFQTDTSTAPETSPPQPYAPRSERVTTPPVPNIRRTPPKMISEPKLKTVRPKSRPQSGVARIKSELSNPIEARQAGSLPPAQQVRKHKRKDLNRTVSRTLLGTPPPATPPKGARTMKHVLVNGRYKWVTNHTIQKWNWSLKDMFLQSGLDPTDIVPLDRLRYYTQQYRRFKDRRDLSAASFLHPDEYFENMRVFTRVCAERNIVVHPR